MSVSTFADSTIVKFKKGEAIDLPSLRTYLLDLDRDYQDGRETGLDDTRYDTLVEIYNSLTGEVIRGDMVSRVKVTHDYPQLKGTVRKVHYITEDERKNDPNAVKAHKSLQEWINKTFNELNPTEVKLLGFWPKYDGCSLILSLDENREVTRAITRGDEELGVDKSYLFKGVKLLGTIPQRIKGKVGLKTEAIMPKSLFVEYQTKFGDPNKPFTNERTAMTSLLNSLDFTTVHGKYLQLKPLFMWANGKFESFQGEDKEDAAPFTLAVLGTPPNDDTLKKIIAEMKKYVDNLNYQCDGIIVRWYDDYSMKTLGRDEANFVNKFEVAYKFPKEDNYTRIKDIRQEIGLLGNASFTAVLEPIIINDKRIEHASLGSYERAKGLNLAKGDMVNIKYEIVPYLCIDEHCEKNRSGKKPIELITHCPYCASELVEDPVLSCQNPECPSRVQGKIKVFCERLNIAGVGEGIIETLFNSGVVRSVQDFIMLNEKKKEFIAIDGLGEKTWKTIVKQIDKLEVPEYQLLAALGIPSIGPKKAKDVMSIYYLDELLKVINEPWGLDQLTKYLTPSLASRLYEGVNANREAIDFIVANIKHTRENPKKSGSKGVIVFTGFRNPSFKRYLEDLGYEVTDSVSKKTTLVITNNPTGTTGKLKKARELGIPIVSEFIAAEEFNFKI